MNNPSSFHTLKVRPDLEIAYLGPHLSKGALPALFYFSLSAEDSLCLDPFNQPALFLSTLPMRVFSMTLPAHENQLPPTQAIHAWAAEIARGNNLAKRFIQDVKFTMESLFDKNAFIPDQIGIAGLSRGAFIATHVAAEISHFRWILGFAPLTQLAFAKEFQDISHYPLVHALSLENLVSQIFDRSLRFYISNLDTLVGTRLCFDFIDKLTQAAVKNHIRSPQVELIITPAIGRFGHGTSKKIFHEGAQWMARKLGVMDDL